MTFIPHLSTIKGEPQDEEENALAYEQSQQQRELERKLRYERRDLATLKAQGANAEAISKQQANVNKANDALDEFCDRTGRHRRKNREYTPITARFPQKDSYSPGEFPTEQRDRIMNWRRNGGR